LLCYRYYGCTKKLPSENASQVSKRANQKVYSIACYEVFERFDKITMSVNMIKKQVKFLRNDKLVGSITMDDGYRPLIPVCALCGPSSALEIVPSISTNAPPTPSTSREHKCKDNMLPALSQSQN
jgi:hypothetical protein